jgi:hypothetical protein
MRNLGDVIEAARSNKELSSEGYLPSNVVTCCKICNRAKHNLTIYEFREWIRDISEKYNEDGKF